MSAHLAVNEGDHHPIRKATVSQVVGAAYTYRRLIPTLLKTTATYYLSGPVQESWPIEIALFTAICQAAGANRTKREPGSPPADPVKIISAFRKVAAIDKLLPPPKTGFATELVIPVVSRGLGGVLQELDAGEDGTRGVKAEWVVANELCYPEAKLGDHVVLYFHGGGYALMSPASHRPLTIALSKALNVRVFSVDYRLAPEDPFPAGLHDAVIAYQHLVDLGIPAENIIVSGDSAGGGLGMALLLYLRDHASPPLPMIGGGALLSPWVDLTSSLGSWDSNKEFDYLIGSSEDSDKTLDIAHLYVSHAKYDSLIIHPYVSSCIANLSTLPPLLIQTGDAEVLRDEDILLAQRASTAGVDVELVILDGGIHVAQAFVHTELSKASLLNIAGWLSRRSAPTKADFTSVDALIDAQWQLRIAKHPHLAGKKSSIPRGPSAPSFNFRGVLQPAPKLEIRANAHPALRAAVEENAKTSDPKPITTFLLAERAPKTGLFSRARGLLHL